VGRGERIVRSVTGLSMIACGVFGLEATALGRGLIWVGVATILTGVFGFCPMCVAVGRKVAKEQP
jgi:hypothetical protein